MSASSKKKLRKEQNAAALTEKQLAAQKESKKLKAYTTTFTVLIVLVVVAALAVAGFTAFMNSGILQRNTNALTIGDVTLTNADLNFFYMDNIQNDHNNWHNSYGDNTQLFVQWMMGLNIGLPLDDQMYDEASGKTFADYYTDMAINSAKEVYAIYNLAVAAGETLTEAQKNELETAMQSMELYAAMYGYSSSVDYLKAMYGPGTTLDGYRNYLTVKTVATNYAKKVYADLEVTDAEIADRNNNSYDEFSEFDYSVFFVDVNDFLPCKNQETAEDHVHSDEEKAVAQKAALEAAKALVASGANTTELLNAAIAASDAYKDNTDAKATDRFGYSLSQVSEEQGIWLKSEARKIGDLEMIAKKTTTKDTEGKETTIDGYQIMLYLGRDDNEQNLVSVRHILVKFTGGTTDANGNTTYSPKEKETALAAIEAIKAEWLANGGTEEAFIALAKEKSTDDGSKANGGLYEDIYPGQMVTNFNDWCFAEEREPGNYEIVETEYGYHLLYFVAKQENTYRQLMIEDALRDEKYTNWYNEQQEAATVTVLDTKYLTRDYVIENH